MLQAMLKRADSRESAAFMVHFMCDASKKAAAAVVRIPGIVRALAALLLLPLRQSSSVHESSTAGAAARFLR